MKKYAIGADVGGSHISCAVINLESKEVLEGTLTSEAVDNKASADEVIARWSLALSRAMAMIDASELAGIGFAMPGPFDYPKGIALFTEQNDKFEKLYNVNVAEALVNSLKLDSVEMVRFMNDATAFAVGESWFGHAKDFDRSLSITLGTGFGSAFLANGVPVVEGAEVPDMGCVWHLPFMEGIADAYFSTRWCTKRYAELSGREVRGVKEIAELVPADSYAAQVFNELGCNLATFLSPWLTRFGAKALVIGGNIAKAYPFFEKPLNATFAQQGVVVEVFVSNLMEEAALVGSAKLFDDSFWGEVQPLLSKM